MVRVFTASPSGFLLQTLTGAGLRPSALPGHWGHPLPPAPPLPGLCLWLNLSETNTFIAWLAEIDPVDSKIEGELAGRSD